MLRFLLALHFVLSFAIRAFFLFPGFSTSSSQPRLVFSLFNMPLHYCWFVHDGLRQHRPHGGPRQGS
uniref:Putative secreted protein n=1 Tax=Anopheles darlingi TaxID=43151 RepID=A0A2M4D6V1_ANODA